MSRRMVRGKSDSGIAAKSQTRYMKIAVFGLGYVGSVTAACLASEGHTVVGVDIDPRKVELINGGCSPVVEPGLERLIADAVAKRRLKAIHDPVEAVANSDVSLICVGTPTRDNGGLETRYVETVCREIGSALATKRAYHVVAVRSTIPSGTTERLLIPRLEESSGKRVGPDFGVVVNPEFLRESTAVVDFWHPPRVLIGQADIRSGDVVASLYDGIEAPVARTDFRLAETVKLVDNTFLALKISFANEIGNLCKREGIDSHALMDVFCLDTKFNLSSAYLKPGFAFGGSCLPKDLHALLSRAEEHALEVPVLSAIVRSNDLQKEIALKLVDQAGKKRVGVLGLAFKGGTGDVRGSPTVELVAALLGKGYQVSIYDPLVSPSNLMGADKAYIERHLPHLSQLMRSSIMQVLGESETLVITHKDLQFPESLAQLHENRVVIDLVRIADKINLNGSRYYGICW